MLHPSTKRLMDRLSEMTRQRRIAWSESPSGLVYETEGYRVLLAPEPRTMQLTDMAGTVLEDIPGRAITETVTEAGESYETVFDEMYREAARQARGTESAIEAVLAGLDREEAGETPAETQPAAETVPDYDGSPDTLEDVSDESQFGWQADTPAQITEPEAGQPLDDAGESEDAAGIAEGQAPQPEPAQTGWEGSASASPEPDTQGAGEDALQPEQTPQVDPSGWQEPEAQPAANEQAAAPPAWEQPAEEPQASEPQAWDHTAAGQHDPQDPAPAAPAEAPTDGETGEPASGTGWGAQGGWVPPAETSHASEPATGAGSGTETHAQQSGWGADEPANQPAEPDHQPSEQWHTPTEAPPETPGQAAPVQPASRPDFGAPAPAREWAPAETGAQPVTGEAGEAAPGEPETPAETPPGQSASGWSTPQQHEPAPPQQPEPAAPAAQPAPQGSGETANAEPDEPASTPKPKPVTRFNPWN